MRPVLLGSGVRPKVQGVRYVVVFIDQLMLVLGGSRCWGSVAHCVGLAVFVYGPGELMIIVFIRQFTIDVYLNGCVLGGGFVW